MPRTYQNRLQKAEAEVRRLTVWFAKIDDALASDLAVDNAAARAMIAVALRGDAPWRKEC